jgi:hypothetical protein
LLSQLRPALALRRNRGADVGASETDGIRTVKVLLIGESRYSFSFCQSLLAKVGCECHIAESRQEIVHILGHAKLDIVLSVSTQQSLAELTALLAGSCSSMFHRLPVEEGCWWLPVVRSGESCLGAPAFRSSEFTRALADIVREMTSEAAARRPTAI